MSIRKIFFVFMCREFRFSIAKGEMLFILIYIHLSNLSTLFSGIGYHL